MLLGFSALVAGREKKVFLGFKTLQHDLNTSG